MMVGTSENRELLFVWEGASLEGEEEGCVLEKNGYSPAYKGLQDANPLRFVQQEKGMLATEFSFKETFIERKISLREGSAFSLKEALSMPLERVFAATQSLLHREAAPLLKGEERGFFRLLAEHPSSMGMAKGIGPKTFVVPEPTSPTHKMGGLEKRGEGLPFRHYETTFWWTHRHQQREREGRQQGGREQDSQDPDQKREKERGAKTEAVAGAERGKAFSARPPQLRPGRGVAKPCLEKPKVALFPLYYLLMKMGIFSDYSSSSFDRQEMQAIQEESSRAHTKRLEQIKEAMEKERAAARWGIMYKVMSWIGSLLGVLSGIALIATGAGAVAGALLVVGGIVQITNQLLEVTGGWQKIAELLPGDDVERKRAVLSWMQIGIAVLCLIFSGVGIIWGGFASVSEAMQIANTCFGAIVAMGQGVTSIGSGVTQFLFSQDMGAVTHYDKIVAEWKQKRQDVMERLENSTERLQRLFEDVARALGFEAELYATNSLG